MSNTTKEMFNFVSMTVLKVILGVCGSLALIFIMEVRADIKEIARKQEEQGKEIQKDMTAIKERVTAVETIVKFKD
jgi:hypothetical protein